MEKRQEKLHALPEDSSAHHRRKRDVRLLILSDIHGQQKKVILLHKVIDEYKPSVLTVCGDLTHFGDLTMASTILRVLVGNGIPTLFVPGNCDPMELASMPTVEGATNLHGRCFTTSGLNFIGVGGSATGPFQTPFELLEDQISQILSEAARKCLMNHAMVLVSHEPPKETKVDTTFFRQHVGSRAVRSFIEDREPILAICGHIHEARGIDTIGMTTIVNPGPLHRNQYALVELNEKVTVQLEALR